MTVPSSFGKSIYVSTNGKKLVLSGANLNKHVRY